MTLYEIDAALMTAIAHGTDPETGEINNLDELMGLQMERDQKIENIACLIKNLKDDVRGLKAEAQALTERRRVAENKVARLEAVLDEALDGQKFSTPAVWCPSAAAKQLRWTMKMPLSTGPA